MSQPKRKMSMPDMAIQPASSSTSSTGNASPSTSNADQVVFTNTMGSGEEEEFVIVQTVSNSSKDTIKSQQRRHSDAPWTESSSTPTASPPTMQELSGKPKQKTKWWHTFLKPSSKDKSSSSSSSNFPMYKHQKAAAKENVEEDDDMGFVSLCPSISAAIPQPTTRPAPPPQPTYSAASLDRIRHELFQLQQEKAAATAVCSSNSSSTLASQSSSLKNNTNQSIPQATSRSNSAFVVPPSWATLEMDSYVSNLAPELRFSPQPISATSTDSDSTVPLQAANVNISDASLSWALRIFKPVEVADGEDSRIMASAGFTHVTVHILESTRASELCQLLSQKFQSAHDLTKFRLYFVQHRTERLIAHTERPVQLWKDSLMRLGHDESDRLWKLGREDHSYCCRFVFKDYPPPPPRPDDFVLQSSKTFANSSSANAKRTAANSRSPYALMQLKRQRARITEKSAYLADVNLSVAPTLLFKMANTLQFLDLSRNTLLDLPADLFARLQNLRMVRLIGNLLTEVPLALLAARSITHLDLSSNFLTGSALSILDGLPSLTHLNVSCNRIADLPVSMGGKPSSYSLRSLDISSNYLTKLPLCIWTMSDLREFNASFNKIDFVPTEISALKSLRSLILVGNGIKTLDSSVTQLPHLRHLDIRGNLLTEIDVPMSSTTSTLESLSNNISDFESIHRRMSISEYHRRGSMDLIRRGSIDQQYYGNRQGAMMESSSSLAQISSSNIKRHSSDGGHHPPSTPSALLELHADYNELASLPATQLWTHLATFTVSNNALIGLPATMHLQALRTLSLSNSRLISLPDDIFENMCMLETLELQNNALTRLPSTICKLRGLKQLVAHSNRLAELDLPGELFPRLEKIIVHTNNISHISPNIWALSSLKVLNLSSNFLASFPDPPPPNSSSIASSSSTDDDVADQTTDNKSAPPLSLVLEEFLAADNRLDDSIMDFLLTPLTRLRVLNLAYNRVFSFADVLSEIGSTLQELYVSGNMLTLLPTGIENCSKLRMLFINGNRIMNIPGELASAEDLVVFDAQSNTLKYNVANWPYDWNWNYSPKLRYLNLANNHRLEIKDASRSSSTGTGATAATTSSRTSHHSSLNSNSGSQQISSPLSTMHHSNLQLPADFKNMTELRILDLTNVKVAANCLPEASSDLQMRVSDANSLGVGVMFTGEKSPAVNPISSPRSPLPADASSQSSSTSKLHLAFAEYCGRSVLFDQTEMVRRKFMGEPSDHLVGLFDGKGHDYISAFLSDTLPDQIKLELRRLQEGEEIGTAIRRAFLSTNREISTHPVIMQDQGSTACLLYFLEKEMFVANVGDTMAVLSREGIAHTLTTKHHAWARGEQARIRELGGYISLQGLVEREISTTRAFGHHNLLPFVNANPAIRHVTLGTSDEFILIATDSFWTVMSYQMAVDVARKERGNPDLAVQKLRDMAIARGVTASIKILLIDLRVIVGGGVIAESMDRMMMQSTDAVSMTERRRHAFRKQEFNDQVLSRLEDEVPPPKPPCSFVFTDIKQSSRLWGHHYNAMRMATKQHMELVRRLCRIHRGYEMKTEGDAFVIAFPTAMSALRFCISVQQQLLQKENWPRELLDPELAGPIYGSQGQLLYRGLVLRMGIHHGMAHDEIDQVARRMDYHGIDIIIASRVSAMADGGQINITEVVRQAFEDGGPEKPDVAMFDLGMLPIKGLDHMERVYAVYPRELAERFHIRSDSHLIDTHRSNASNTSMDESLSSADPSRRASITGNSPYEFYEEEEEVAPSSSNYFESKVADESIRNISQGQSNLSSSTSLPALTSRLSISRIPEEEDADSS